MTTVSKTFRTDFRTTDITMFVGTAHVDCAFRGHNHMTHNKIS